MQRKNTKRASSPPRNLAPREVVALKRFKDSMKKNAGKLRFAGHGD